jgi:large subunit ribosomal protein L1
MGKIRVKALGDEELEQKQAEELLKRKEAKIAEEKAKGQAEKVEELEVEEAQAEKEETSEVKAEKKPVKIKKDEKDIHSAKYGQLATKVDPSKLYTVKEGLELLKDLQRGKFDETVELHINTTNPGVSGSLTLPHGTGKQTRVAIADDKLIAEIEKGIINFDILLAEPQMMPKLARVARVLGPKGLMPNPKNGTVTEKTEEASKKYAGGQVNFKTESKNPLLHLMVGKVSFGTDKLAENITAMLAAVKKSNIVNVTLKSTMSPGIKIKA